MRKVDAVSGAYDLHSSITLDLVLDADYKARRWAGKFRKVSKRRDVKAVQTDFRCGSPRFQKIHINVFEA